MMIALAIIICFFLANPISMAAQKSNLIDVNRNIVTL